MGSVGGSDQAVLPSGGRQGESGLPVRIDSAVALHLTGIGGNKVPDERTILNFRHLLERHGLGKVLLESIKEHLAEQGLKLREGTILDGSIIAAPSSRKNRRGEGDAQMKQSKQG